MRGLRRAAALAALAAVAVLAGPAVALRPDRAQPASARAFVVQVLQPGAAPVSAGVLEGPPTAKVSLGAGFTYPDDGSIVSIGAANGEAAVDGRHPVAAADSELSSVSLLGGEITADSVSARASTSARAGVATGNFLGTSIQNLQALGSAVHPSPNLQVPLADWGHMVVLAEQSTPGRVSGVASFHEVVTAIDVTLDADHAGLPAGTRIELGGADAFSRLPLLRKGPATTAPAGSRSPQPPSVPAVRPATPAPRTVLPLLDRPEKGKLLPLGPLDITAKLTKSGYVFPVYGPVAYGDTFGAPRADTGWHHGDDIFAPLGAPILAVAGGTVYSVGWQKIGGNRLWLRDRHGNEFYYAHLSAYSPLASNGATVRAGDVLGFVGNTGDAEGTPYHLHFEIHPGPFVFLGEDGVIDPTPYLDAWRRLQDIRFPSGLAWAPVIAPRSTAPMPGAVLLQETDISSADGLDPGSLQRAVESPPAGAEGAPISLG